MGNLLSLTLRSSHEKDDSDDQYHVGDDRDNHDYDDRDEELDLAEQL